MALETQDITIDFGQGLEQKTDSKRIPIGSLTVANNVLFTKDKQVRRRYGLTALASATTTTNVVNRLLPDVTVPSLFQDERNYYRTAGATYVKQTNVDTTPSLELQNKQLVVDDLVTTTTAPSVQCASAVNGDYRIVVFKQTATQIYFTILSTVDNKEIVSRKELTASASLTREFQILVNAGVFYVFYVTSTSTTAVRSVTTAGVVSAASTIAGSTLGAFDVLDDGSNGFYFVQHNTASTRNRVTRQPYINPGTPTWTTDFTTVAGVSVLCFARHNDTRTELVVYYATVTTIYYSRYTLAGVNSANGTYTAIAFNTPTAIAAAINPSTSDHILVLCGRFTADSATTVSDFRSRVFCNTGTYTAPNGSASYRIPGLLLTNLATITGDRKTYALTRNGVFVSITCFTIPVAGGAAQVSAERIRTVSRVFIDTPLQSTGVDYGFSSQTSPEVSGTEIRFTTARVIQPFNTAAPTTSECTYKVALATLTDLTATQRNPVAVLQNNTYAPGAQIATTAGFSGFTEPARLITVSATGAETHSAYVVIRSLDEKPYYSPLSEPFTFTAATATFTIVPPPIGAQNAVMELYATENNGSVYYLCESVTISPLSLTGVVTIAMSSAVSSASQQLYAQGGALENIPPAAPRWVCSAKNRLWCPSPENNTDLFHSSQPITGEDVRWHPDLVVKVPAQGGEITAVIEHNQRMLVFKKNAVYAVSGDGPGLTGAGGSFQVDQLSTSYGCEGPNAIKLIPGGVIFKSADQGFWFVTDRYEFEYIGRGVDTYKTNSIMASVHVPSQNQVRFLLPTDTDGSASVFLVYDYYYKQWFTHRVTLSSSGPFEKTVDTCVSGDGRLYFLTDATTPRVLYEDPANYVDGSTTNTSTAYRPTLTTGWINFADVDGFQRIRYFDIQGTNTSAGGFTFNVTVYYNYDDASSPDYFTFAMTAGNTNATNKLIRRIFLSDGKQKSRAIKVEITAASGSAEAFGETTLTGLTFRVGLKKKAAPADEGSRS